MASPFASLVTSDPIPLPFDSGQWIRVRKLTGKQYEAVQQSHRAGFVTGDKWAGFFRAVAEGGPTSESTRKILSDPLTGHDRYALITEGLVAWSYEQVVGADAIADLDDDAIDFIAREVLKLTKPSLFIETIDDAETERKNG